MLPPFGWNAVLTQWQSAPVVTASVVILAALYLWGVVRVGRQHPARPWPRWRTGLFLGGLAVIVIALQSGIGTYDDVLFWDHMVQHLMLIMVAPPLLIFGQPITLLLHASRNPLHTWVKKILRSKAASFLTWPVFGFAAYAAAIVVLHLTAVANLIARNDVAHEAEHVVFLVVGYLFFLPIIGSEPIKWRLSYPTKLILLFLIMPVDTFTGLVLSYGNRGTPGLPLGSAACLGRDGNRRPARRRRGDVGRRGRADVHHDDDRLPDVEHRLTRRDQDPRLAGIRQASHRRTRRSGHRHRHRYRRR